MTLLYTLYPSFIITPETLFLQPIEQLSHLLYKPTLTLTGPSVTPRPAAVVLDVVDAFAFLVFVDAVLTAFAVVFALVVFVLAAFELVAFALVVFVLVAFTLLVFVLVFNVLLAFVAQTVGLFNAYALTAGSSTVAI